MASGKLILAGVFVLSAALGVVPLFLHDKSAVASKVTSSGSMPSSVSGSAAGGGAAAGGNLGAYGSKQLLRGELSGEEKVKLFEAEQAYYNALEEVLVQRYTSTFFEDYRKQNSLPDVNSAQAKFFEGKFAVSETEVDKFLGENKDNPGLQRIPEGDRKGQIRTYLESRAKQGAMRQLVDDAKEKGAIRVAMDKPIEPKIDVTDAGNPSMGAATAKVTIIEFADYQCPFCARVVPVLQGILKRYDGKVRWVFRDFPLREIHPEAMPSAAFANCAAKQGKFWEAHHKLFENYATLGTALYDKLATEIGLDKAQLDECRKDPAVSEEILADQADGSKYGVQGTPTYFINGRKAPGDEREMSRIIDEELAKL